MNKEKAMPAARILVIEDEPEVRTLLVEALSSEYEVTTASDGEKGIALAQTFMPDLVICDLVMPHMDGFAVLKHLQSLDAFTDVPFIFLSALNSPEIFREGMSLGADDFLAKPVSVKELRRVIQRRLDRRAKRLSLIQQAIEDLRLSIATSLPHELRTGIMIVEGYTHLILENGEQVDPMQRAMLETIRDNASRLRQMAEKYLWYVKLSFPGSLTPSKTASETSPILEHISRDVARRCSRQNDLNVYVENSALYISKEDLSKIAEELLENGFKFSQPGSPVSLWGLIEGEVYSLAVHNFGPPFHPEQLEHIAGFVQFDRQRYEQQGTGLGLVIAKRLAEAYGGHISIVSEHGQTSVAAHLPLRVAEE